MRAFDLPSQRPAVGTNRRDLTWCRLQAHLSVPPDLRLDERVGGLWAAEFNIAHNGQHVGSEYVMFDPYL